MSPLLLALSILQPAQAFVGQLVAPDNEQKLQWHCDDVQIVQGTVPYAVAVEARQSYARTYSAVAELEHELLPQLAHRDDGSVFRISSNSLFNVARLPSTACGQLASQVYDVGSYNMSMGLRTGRFALFYSAAATYALVSQDWSARTVKHGGGFLLGHFYSFSAPIWGSRVINADDIGGDAFTDDWAFLSSGDGAIGGVSLDYIAGASADLDVVAVGAGYVGSRGLYVHFDQPQSGAFLDTVTELASGDVDPLRYLKTGLSGFRWFLDRGTDARRKVGATDATFARYRVVSPTGQILTASDAQRSNTDTNADTLALTQLQQRNLWERRLDVSARYQLAPSPQLYEASLRLHTPQYHVDLLAPGRRNRRIKDDFAGSVAAGLVNLPRRTYFGVPGGPRPFIAADAVLYMNNGDPLGSYFRTSLKVNDPDTLIVFPYAQGATELHFAFHIAN